MAMLQDQIASNRRRSMLIFLFVPVIMLALIAAIGYALFGSIMQALIIGIIGSIFYTIITYVSSERLILRSVGAQEADRQQHEQLYDLVEGLTIASGMQMPQLYVQESDQINAFATGKNPENGIICVTTGAMHQLEKDELEGVLAHELAHIQNHDMRLQTITVALIGGISILAEMFIWGAIFGGGQRDKSPVAMIVGLVVAILAPIAARLAQLAISRQREFLADATGAHMTRYPDSLAGALEKIKQQSQPMQVDKAMASMYFGNPFKKDVGYVWSTHPPVDERIQRLREM